MAAGWNARGRQWRGAPNPDETRLATQLVATLTTSLGDIEVELFPDHAPKTVANFVELAEGTREWTDPQTRSRQQSRLYDGTIFHRVIPGFMIQGGDPLGTGTGGPGYQFKDEIHPDLSLIHISEPTRLLSISYAVFCLKKKKNTSRPCAEVV